MLGREAAGRIAGKRFDEVCDQLRRDLLDVVNVHSGRPLVRDVVRTDSVYERWDDDRLPDLLVEWDRDHEAETVWSPKVGLLHGPAGLWRSGDHMPDGLLLVTGGGAAGREADIDMADVGPTVCSLFGTDLPGADGLPIRWLST